MHPDFLCLEKKLSSTAGLESVLVSGVPRHSTDEILTAITDFYSELYADHNINSESQIRHFLQQIPSLPMVMQDTTSL